MTEKTNINQGVTSNVTCRHRTLSRDAGGGKPLFERSEFGLPSVFLLRFLWRLCVTRRIVSRGWKSLPVNFPFRREDNRAGHIGDGML